MLPVFCRTNSAKSASASISQCLIAPPALSPLPSLSSLPLQSLSSQLEATEDPIAALPVIVALLFMQVRYSAVLFDLSCCTALSCGLHPIGVQRSALAEAFMGVNISSFALLSFHS